MSNSSNITAKLQDASDGLLMPSESEHPFEPFVWSKVSDLTPEKVLELTDHPQDAPIQTVDMGYLFNNIAQEQEWHDDQQKADVKKYRKLVETLQANLSDIQVYRVGKRSLDVYIVGKTESGNLAGLATKVVET